MAKGKRYSYAERAAYHQGFGFGSAGAKFTDPKKTAVIARFKTKEERVSFQAGMLDGQTKVHNKIAWGQKNNKVSKDKLHYWQDFWGLHDD